MQQPDSGNSPSSVHLNGDVLSLMTAQPISETLKPKTLRCLEDIDAGLLKQFQRLCWAMATGAINSDVNVYLEGNELFVENEDDASSHDDPSGKAEEIDRPDEGESNTHAFQTTAASKLTALVNENEFEAFIEQATQTTIDAETGETTALNSGAAELWQHIQSQAQRQADMSVFSQLSEYGQINALIEALDKQLFQYAQMLLEPSLDALLENTPGSDPSSQSELFVVKILQRLSSLNSAHLKSLSGLVFSMVMEHGAESAAEITDQAGIDTSGKAEAADIELSDSARQTESAYTAQPISLEAAQAKARCLLTIALATGASEQGLDVTCLSHALYYLSFVGTDKPILGIPDFSSGFPELKQAGIDALLEYLDTAIKVIPDNGLSQLIAEVLKSIYINPALKAEERQADAAVDLEANTDGDESPTKLTVSPILEMLINHFKGSTVEIAEIELDSFLDGLAQGPLNQAITTPAGIVERIIAVEDTLFELCAEKIRFEITQDDYATQDCSLSEFTAEQKSEQLLTLCQTKTRDFTPAHLLKVRLLLWAGADVTTTNMYGYTPLHLACGNGRTETAEALINALIEAEQTEALVATDNEGNTPLHLACGNGRTETAIAVIKALVDTGQTKTLVAKDNDGNTPLHLACRNGHTETAIVVIKALVDTGQTEALVAIDKYGDTPLHLACLNGHTETAVALIKALVETGQTGALVAKDNRGYTPLHWACFFGYTQTAIVVIKALVDTRQTESLVAVDEEGYTPLHWACENWHTETAEALIRFLIETGQTEALAAKNKYGDAPMYRTLSRACIESNVVVIRAMIEARQIDILRVIAQLRFDVLRSVRNENTLLWNVVKLRVGLYNGLRAYRGKNRSGPRSLKHIQAFRVLLVSTERMSPHEAMTQLLAMLEEVLMDDNMGRQPGSLTTLLMQHVKEALKLKFDIEAHKGRWSAQSFRFGGYKRTAREDFLSLLKTKLGLGSSATHAEVDGDGDDINTDSPGYH